jgi:transcriptional regulator with XRE-family HTH domain
MMPELAQIEKKRRSLDVSMAALARAAGMPASYYSYFLLSGRVKPRTATLKRLHIAVRSLQNEQSSKLDRDYALNIAYRMALAMAAEALGMDVALVHRSDPKKRATHSEAWMRAAEVRRLAIYLLNAGTGFSQSEVARAAGMTKQGVCEAMKAFENRRDDPAFDALLEKLTTAIMGE